MAVRNNGDANGFQKLVATGLKTVQTPSVQRILRQLMTWANNLVQSTPKEGQVLKAITLPDTVLRQQGPMAIWGTLPTTTGTTYPPELYLTDKSVLVKASVNDTVNQITSFTATKYFNFFGKIRSAQTAPLTPSGSTTTAHQASYFTKVKVKAGSWSINDLQFALEARTSVNGTVTISTIIVRVFYFANTAFTKLGTFSHLTNVTLVVSPTGPTPVTISFSAQTLDAISVKSYLLIDGWYKVTTVTGQGTFILVKGPGGNTPWEITLPT